MTIAELSQLYFLEQEISRYDAKIDELRARRAATSAPAFDREPGGSRPGAGDSKVERLTAEIIDLGNLLRLHREQRAIEHQRLERYISTVQDAQVRQIMHLRFEDLLPWQEVAREMHYSEVAVKKRLYRYLESSET